MAVRLPVVLCQHERRNGKQAEHEEQWITALLFEERLDATLVTDLGLIEPDSTDHLCLEGLRGDFVIVSWQSKESVAEQLLRLGFQSFDLVPLDGSKTTRISKDLQMSGKKIYYHPFNLEKTVEDGLNQIKQLLVSRSTPVFQLNIGFPKEKSEGALPANTRSLPVINDPDRPSILSTEANTGVPRNSVDANSVDTNGAKPPVAASSRFAMQPQRAAVSVDLSDESDFGHIDALMDDLDNFDG